MRAVFQDFKHAHHIKSGPLLASTLTPTASASDPLRLRSLYHDINSFNLSLALRNGLLTPKADLRLSKAEGNAWVELYAAYWKFLGEVVPAAENRDVQVDWPKTYEAWKEVANSLIRGYTSAGFQAWTVPCLYVAGRFLRIFAIKADESLRGSGDDGKFSAGDGFQDDVVGELGKNEKLEDSARMINRIFTLCISDRAPLEESRKWGLYYTTNLLFKTYFKLNSIGLSKNILRALEASQTDMPPIEAFPKSHIVTFHYYVGVILFLDENYVQAEEKLTNALNMCHRDAHRNKEFGTISYLSYIASLTKESPFSRLILTYLIPCHLLTTHTLPSRTLLQPYPRLHNLFTPLSKCIRRGDLAGFDTALAAGENEFVKRRIYLTLERGRDIALRNLFRKVFIAGGFEESKDGGERIRRTRVPLHEFVAAVRLGSGSEDRWIDDDEVECLLANMIYKRLHLGARLPPTSATEAKIIVA